MPNYKDFQQTDILLRIQHMSIIDEWFLHSLLSFALAIMVFSGPYNANLTFLHFLNWFFSRILYVLPRWIDYFVMGVYYKLSADVERNMFRKEKLTF